MPAAGARYDGYAEWYDSWNMPHIERNGPEVAGLLGPGEGLCLDLGCGGGLYFGILAGTGRTVVGLDRSADQLRIARGHDDTADAAEGWQNLQYFLRPAQRWPDLLARPAGGSPFLS
jgi:2-polyprenyl-3-methyl-5-hydroxy-6-metoxy-1,4-benzoquinol methylase